MAAPIGAEARFTVEPGIEPSCSTLLDHQRELLAQVIEFLEVSIGQVCPIELEPEQADVTRLVDAPAHRGDDRSRLEQVGLHAARHAERLGAIRRLADRDQTERALLSHNVARVGNPRRRSKALVFHLDAECRDGTLAHDVVR